MWQMPRSQPAMLALFCVVAALASSLENDEAQQAIPDDDIAIHNVTLMHQQKRGTTPLNFTFTYPVQAPTSRKPLVMLFNGAEVESYWYRRIIGQLARKGFVVVSTDYYRDVDLPARPGCRKDAFIAVSARLINTLYDFLRSDAAASAAGNAPEFVDAADLDQLLLLSHSLGGFIAFKTLAGFCKLDPLDWDPSCEGYEPVLNSAGKDVIIGSVAYEGYLSGLSFPRLHLPEGTFAFYISGQYNSMVKKAFEGTLDTGGCASYIKLRNDTHYGMNDYVAPPSTHQVAPCSQPAMSDPKDFMTDRATQEAGVDLIADIIDAFLRVRQGAEAAAAEEELRSLIRQPRVMESELHLHCLAEPAAMQ